MHAPISLTIQEARASAGASVQLSSADFCSTPLPQSPPEEKMIVPASARDGSKFRNIYDRIVRVDRLFAELALVTE